MRWVRRTEDGAYIVRRTAEGWTVETVNRRGRNLFGPRLVSQEAALAVIRGTSAMGRNLSGLRKRPDARALRHRRRTAGGRHPASGSPPRPRR